METPGLNEMLASELDDEDYSIVRDSSVTASVNKDKKLKKSSLLTWLKNKLGFAPDETAADYQTRAEKDQPNGYPGLNPSGQLVRRIVLQQTTGVLDPGELSYINGTVVVGDGVTEDGNPVGESEPIGEVLESNATRTLSPTKSGQYFFTLGGNGTTLTISNANSLPLGFSFNVVMYAEGGETMTVNGGFINVVKTGLSAGLHCLTISRILGLTEPGVFAVTAYTVTPV
jgi:hypothetical protein